MISVYRPYNPSTSGVQTMYDQHSRILSILQELRFQVMQYLKLYIQTLQENGNPIILGMNLTNLIQRHDHTIFFDEIYLHEVIISTHT